MTASAPFIVELCFLLAEAVGGFELNHLACRNHQLLLGAGVDARAFLHLVHLESAEADELYLVFVGQGLGDALQAGVQGRLCLNLVQRCLGGNLVNQICLFISVVLG